MKTPPHRKKEHATLDLTKPDTSRNGSRFLQLRQHEISCILTADYQARQKNPNLPLWNRSSLAARIGCKPKTIGRDIQSMINSLGHPIAYIPSRHGYIYTEPFTPVLSPAMTEAALARICIALLAIESFKDSPIFAAIQDDVQRLIKSLTERVGVDFAAFASCVTFKNTGVDATVDPTVVETLITAIQNRQELEIVYSKLNRTAKANNCSNGSLSHSSEISASTTTLNSPDDSTVPFNSAAPWLRIPVETRKVHPLHLFCIDSVWYLYLWDPNRRAIRRFLLSRMRSITPTGKNFRPRKFDIERERAYHFRVTSGDPVNVRIQFRGKASYLVAERPWHQSQKLAPGPDAEWNLELTMQCAHTPELERWTFGFDEDFRVLEPEELREAINRKSQRMTANHIV